MVKRRTAAPQWHTCPGCGKRAYPTRGDAKQAARGQIADLRAYRCERRPEYWHLGTLPPEVRRGVVPRDNVCHVLDAAELAQLGRVFGGGPGRDTP